MANKAVAFPLYGDASGDVVPIKAIDLGGDAAFAISISTGTASGIKVAFPAVANSGQQRPIDTVDNLDGTYSLKVST